MQRDRIVAFSWQQWLHALTKIVTFYVHYPSCYNFVHSICLLQDTNNNFPA